MDIDSQFFLIVSSSGETYPSSLSLISSILFSLLSFDLTSNSLSDIESSLSDIDSSLSGIDSSLLIVRPSKEDTISLLSCVVVIPLLSIFKFLISSSNNFRISV